MMKTLKTIFSVFLYLIFSLTSHAAIMQNEISKNTDWKYNQIIDKTTQKPIAGAKIRMPQSNYTTYTDNNGKFSIPTQVNPNTILSVEKQNYRPFSITITDKTNSAPLNLSIEKSNKSDIIIDTNIYHIGDNNFSMASANAYQFRSQSVGSTYIKTFFMPTNIKNKENYLVIGSIIGIDTALARGMGQNSITTSYASPPRIFFNGQKIAEIHINGDNQKIKIPNYLIRENQQNEIKIIAGINLKQTAYIDFDDIEFMNLNIE